MNIWGNVKKIFGYIRHPKRLLYPNTYNNERFCEYLRSKGAVIGDGTRFISPSHCVVDPGKIDYISIGKNCCLSVVSIIAHDYSWYTFLDTFDDVVPDPGGEIVIGNNVFIGYKACILKNTQIGDNVIIGAGAIVKGIIPSNTVWAGIPAKQICTLEVLYKKKLLNKLNDAVYRRDFIKKKYGRNPTIEQMGFFQCCFCKEMYEKYISPLEINGVRGSEMIRKVFLLKNLCSVRLKNFCNIR